MSLELAQTKVRNLMVSPLLMLAQEIGHENVSSDGKQVGRDSKADVWWLRFGVLACAPAELVGRR